MKKEHFALLLILLLAAFLRFWQLGVVPIGVTHDELGYIWNSYSIAKTGRNVFGEFLPFLTWINRGGWPFLPVPTYLGVPFFWLFDVSATTGRLASALLGIVDVMLLYILVKQIFDKRPLALLAAFFLAISPWHLHFSRSAYDTNFAFFFFLLGIVIFIREIKKRKLPIFSLVSFLLAIFSYRGMNIIFPPLVVVLIWYSLVALKIRRHLLVAFSIGVGFIMLSLIFFIATYGRTYMGEVLNFNNSKMQEDIDIQIREAKGPIFIRRLFLNKPAYIISELRENYVKAYSPEFLFLYTEPNGIYSIWSRGRIYFFDMILIIMGIAYLYGISKKGASFVIMLFLIGGLPGMFGGLPYSARNFFVAAILPILSAGGVLFLVNSVSLLRLKPIIIISFILSYSYFLGSYLFDYYGRYAFYGAEAWAKSLKDLSLTILDNKEKYDKIVIGPSSFGDFLEYAFYAKISPSEVQKAWHLREKTASFSIENLAFIQTCPEIKKVSLKDYKKELLITHESCKNLATPSGFIKDFQGNTIWKIYEN